jgi:hypothetical protein
LNTSEEGRWIENIADFRECGFFNFPQGDVPGGGVHCEGIEVLKIFFHLCEFMNLSTPSYGGSLFIGKIEITEVESTTFENSSALGGGSLNIFHISLSLFIHNCSFKDSSGSLGNGGILIENMTSIDSDSSFNHYTFRTVFSCFFS